MAFDQGGPRRARPRQLLNPDLAHRIAYVLGELLELTGELLDWPDCAQAAVQGLTPGAT
jgi:hypothetical protein